MFSGLKRHTVLCPSTQELFKNFIDHQRTTYKVVSSSAGKPHSCQELTLPLPQQSPVNNYWQRTGREYKLDLSD